MLIDALHHRYATKHFSADKKVSENNIDKILEAGRLAPTSYGVQPFRFIVIEDLKKRLSLQPACYNQPQITDASHLVLLQVRISLDENFVNAFILHVEKERSLPQGALDDFKNMIIQSKVEHQTPESIFAWNQKQAYIALGFMIVAAAVENIDACPMEGFVQSQVDTILETESLFQTVALLALGYRDDSDPYASYLKVRAPHQDIIIKM